MAIKEHITAKNIIFFILVLLILKALSEVMTIALLFFASFVIASSLNPIADKLEQKMNRTSAVAIVLSGALVVFCTFFVPVIFIGIKQVQGLLAILPEKIGLIQDFVFNHDFYGHKLPELLNVSSIASNSTQITTGLVNQSINITMSFAQGVLFLLAICMIVFYFMQDKKIIKDGFIKLFPQKMKSKASELYDTISHKVGGYVIAQVLNMVAIAILTALCLMVLKIDYALLLGIITGTLDIIPIVGPTIALILCLIMAYQTSWLKVALVLIGFLAVQWISNNLVRPVIFGKFLDLHPLIIIFALLVAAQFLGLWGVILAPAIASLVCVLFEELYVKTINKS